MPDSLRTTQTVSEVLHEEEVEAGSMEKYNTAPPIHLANKQFSISAEELHWSTWQDSDQTSTLPSLAIQYYEEVRAAVNVDFQGTLTKKGQANRDWKGRIFAINPDKDFFVRYYLEDVKVARGNERGSIDIEDIINIETRPADKSGFILILLKTSSRVYELSTQDSQVAGTFIGVLQNVKDIVGSHLSKKIAGDMSRHKGKVLVKGWMQKMGKVHRNWKRRFFVLDTTRDYLIRYYDKEDTTIKPKGTIDLVDVNLVQKTQNDSVLNVNPYSFDCITDERTFHIAAESAEQRDQWVSVLGEVIGQDSEKKADQPIHKGIVRRHEESQRRNIVGKAFVGLSRKLQAALKEVEGYLVLFSDKVIYFKSPKRFDLWTRTQLMKGDAKLFDFEPEEVEIKLLTSTLHRVTGFGEGKDRFALIWRDTRYIFSCKSKTDTERWMDQLSKIGDMNVSVMPKY